MPLPGPDTRVVELRVPGLIGTSGESLLDSMSTVEVAGDGLGRVVRPSDRLRRPAPGPVLPALGRSIPRTLEGYLWSGMTSGGAAKATWALLFPFSLANVAHWMLPPVPEGSRVGRVLNSACRSLLRLASLLLTMLLVTQVAVISLDLFAGQCLAPGSSCLKLVPDGLREVAAVRTIAGMLPLLALIYILHRISSADWTTNGDQPAPKNDVLPGDTLRASSDIPVLRCLHSVAALASVALLPLGGPFRLPAAAIDVVAWACALALLAGSLVLAAFTHEPFRARSLGPWGRRIVVWIALLLLALVSVRHTPLPDTLSGVGLIDAGPPSGVDGTVEGIGIALIGICLLFALLLIPAALLTRHSWRRLPKRLRPWLGGWGAAPALALAGLLGGGFGAGTAVALRQLLGADDLRLPDSYQLITILWGAGLVLAMLLGLVGFAVAVPLRRRIRGIPEVVRLLQDSPDDQKEAAAAWARSAWERRHLHHIALAVGLAMSAGVAILLAVRFVFGKLPDWLDPLSGVGVVALGAMAAGLLRVIYTAAKTPNRSRHLGALADLVCFWPRAAHPSAPPCYALKVVPELAARAKEHLAEPGNRVVLAGYNLGGLLAVVAASRLARSLPPDQLERTGLVTAGSPLQWGYQRAFPAVLPLDGLAELYGVLDGRWRGLARGTDIFGGGVTTWRHQVADGKLLGVGYLPDGGIGPLPAAEVSETGALVLGGDHWLPDPMRNSPGTRRWAAGVLRHADYVVDPEWDHALAMAAGLERPGSPSAIFGEQVPLFGDLPTFTRD
ncbi:hypothetical protein [Amycolatopsis nigrescens]|uniref:hypothetical protein n=1 Tax=Amycolatopsis nigrescens TaxID=381445 RepID=UPI00036A3201|nr:hypothetical protein [Amycolatopsis nigrescens]